MADSTTATKTPFTGSCHCGFIKYRAHLSLGDPPTATRCNCTVCLKQGFTGTRLASPSDFELLSPSSLSEVKDYQIRSKDVHKHFCGNCGIHVLGRGKYEYQGVTHEFCSLNILTLDQPQDGLDLSKFKIQYWDGRNDNWQGGTKDVPWPGGCV
ncbi:uncharacterized protein Z518_05112 [Rhinocladiella mackenziei CBS 650.93]|uniref:CENP-V/GFA domain-containing protein n=1 Tax=Rhinocladiella mackenziei CBS 650.93 TaxID=1442369 RepID=A0A0D2JD95_9EURO|nr:uncharacterized protein Z518_05112 [Rhinocladiella mackenziei CBS 650.93]KIX07135.1 hypothetical protein Z518_05112 [Rhinocladiella mackenziei CBS 650.93]